MPTKMRLQRFGKKGQPFYHIVVADGRAPRDGRYIEKIGVYNPLTKPATIDLDFDRALYWVKTGAQPTETVEAILKYEGVAYMHHLLKGVTKGALNEEQAKNRFEEWKTGKLEKIQGARNKVESAAQHAEKKLLEAEAKVNAAKAAEIAKKNAPEPAPELAAEPTPEPAAETAPETAPEAIADNTPEVVAETTPEVVAEPLPADETPEDKA